MRKLHTAIPASVLLILPAAFGYFGGHFRENPGPCAASSVDARKVSESTPKSVVNECSEWFSTSFSAEKEFLDSIRNALAHGTNVVELPQLHINLEPSRAWVAVTLFQEGNKPIRWITRRKTAIETINRIIQKLTEYERFSAFTVSDPNRCRVMLEVITDEQPLDIRHLHTDRFDESRYEPGITGFKLKYDDKIYYYMPTDAVVHSHMSIKHALNHISKVIGVAEKTNKISERVRLIKGLPAQWSIIRSVAFITYKDDILPLYRGYPVPVEFSTEKLRVMTRQSVDWVCNNMNEDGRFLYYYDGVTDSIIDHAHPNRTEQDNYYNILRHCGGVVTVLRAYELTKDRKYLDAAEKAIQFLLRNVIEHRCEGRKAYYVYYNEKAKLGGTGIGLVALLRYYQITGDSKFNDYIFGMANHLLSRICEDGEMIGYYIHPLYNAGRPIISPSPKERKALFSFYYPGEALMGLALFYREMDITDEYRGRVRDAATKALDFLVNIRPERYPELFKPLPSDGWLMQAIEEWSYEKEFQKKEYLDFVFGDAREMISHMYNEEDSAYCDYPGTFYYNYGDHAYPDGARAEGLIAAYYLAKRMRQQGLADYILANCRTVAKSLMYTYNSAESTYMHKYPEKSVGSFRFKLTRHWMRVDTVQHAACFYVRLLSAMKRNGSND